MFVDIRSVDVCRVGVCVQPYLQSFVCVLTRSHVGSRVDQRARPDVRMDPLESLKAADLIKDDVKRVRVFLSGEIGRAVNVRGVTVTKGAKAAIEAAGGSVEA